MRSSKVFVVIVSLALTSCTQRKAEMPADVAYYTCSMHPSVKTHDPKIKCPICGMELVPVKKQGTTAPGGQKHDHGQMTAQPPAEVPHGPSEFVVPVERQQQIGVTYATVETRSLQKTVRTVGTVAYDKQRHWDFVSRVDGYVQKLHVSSRGELVEKDQPLLTIYSPELLTAQREFLNAVEMIERGRTGNSTVALESAERMLEASKTRLRLWNITEPQIAELMKAGKPSETLTFYSPFRGVIQDVAVDQGRRVAAGDHLIDVADLSVVWVWVDFYQDELPLLRPGQTVAVQLPAEPEQKFSGKVAVIDPFIDPERRTARVRLELDNPDFRLRPGMYVDAELQLDFGKLVAIPVTAVMPTGKRNVVFVDKGEGRLEPRLIELGRRVGDFYAIQRGLKEGERVVNSANFLIDAEAKVQGALKGW